MNYKVIQFIETGIPVVYWPHGGFRQQPVIEAKIHNKLVDSSGMGYQHINFDAYLEGKQYHSTLEIYSIYDIKL